MSSTDDWPRIKQLFQQALDQPEAGRREFVIALEIRRDKLGADHVDTLEAQIQVDRMTGSRPPRAQPAGERAP